jgi:hypothetical protein
LRPNTVLTVAYDLKVFFTVVGRPAAPAVAAGGARPAGCTATSTESATVAGWKLGRRPPVVR